jgi:hypothetical protein
MKILYGGSIYIYTVYILYTWVHSLYRMHPGQPGCLVRPTGLANKTSTCAGAPYLPTPSIPPLPLPPFKSPHQGTIRRCPWTPQVSADRGSRRPPGERRRGGCLSDERRRAGGDLSPVDATSGAGRSGSRRAWRGVRSSTYTAGRRPPRRAGDLHGARERATTRRYPSSGCQEPRRPPPLQISLVFVGSHHPE